MRPRLTSRQAQVVSRKLSGLGAPLIAKELGLGRKTVDAHLCAAMHRLGCASWSELMDAYATTRERYVVS